MLRGGEKWYQLSRTNKRQRDGGGVKPRDRKTKPLRMTRGGMPVHQRGMAGLDALGGDLKKWESNRGYWGGGPKKKKERKFAGKKAKLFKFGRTIRAGGGPRDQKKGAYIWGEISAQGLTFRTGGGLL